MIFWSVEVVFITHEAKKNAQAVEVTLKNYRKWRAVSVKLAFALCRHTIFHNSDFSPWHYA